MTGSLRPPGARPAALVSGAAGGWRPRSRSGGPAAGSDRLPGERGAAEGVGEVAAASLAGRLVQLERVQRLAVVRELGPAVVVATDRAEHTAQAGRCVQAGSRRHRHREPEAEAAAGAQDLAVRLLLRRVDGLAGAAD